MVSNYVVIPFFFLTKKKFYKVLRKTIRANEFHILSSFHFFLTPAYVPSDLQAPQEFTRKKQDWETFLKSFSYKFGDFTGVTPTNNDGESGDGEISQC